MTRKKSIVALAVLLPGLALALAAAFYASPYWSVHQLKQAAQQRDVDALLARVDQKALRHSVRLALGFQLAETLQADAADEAGPVAPQGRDIALEATLDPLTEALTSPTLLMAMLLEGRPSRALGHGVLPMPLLVPEAASGDWRAEIRWLDGSTVQVRAKDVPDAGGFVLRRSGIANWRLVALLPPDR